MLPPETLTLVQYVLGHATSLVVLTASLWMVSRFFVPFVHRDTVPPPGYFLANIWAGLCATVTYLTVSLHPEALPALTHFYLEQKVSLVSGIVAGLVFCGATAAHKLRIHALRACLGVYPAVIITLPALEIDLTSPPVYGGVIGKAVGIVLLMSLRQILDAKQFARRPAKSTA